jgi:hypothetical protein
VSFFCLVSLKKRSVWCLIQNRSVKKTKYQTNMTKDNKIRVRIRLWLGLQFGLRLGWRVKGKGQGVRLGLELGKG